MEFVTSKLILHGRHEISQTDSLNDITYHMTVAIELTSDHVLVALNDLIEIVGLNEIRLTPWCSRICTRKTNLVPKDIRTAGWHMTDNSGSLTSLFCRLQLMH